MSDDMSDWSDLKASWKASTDSSFDAERIRELKSRIEMDVRRMRFVSSIELLATVIIASYLGWLGLSGSSFVESAVLFLIAIAALAVQGVIMQMRRHLALTVAETARALWSLKAKRARLARRIALLGLVAGPAGVVVGYLLATHLGATTTGGTPMASLPVATVILVLFVAGMIYSALEARRAGRDLAEALATLAWLGEEEA